MLCIFTISLMAPPIFHFFGIGQNDGDTPFEEIENGNPVGPSALHHDIRHVFVAKPRP